MSLVTPSIDSLHAYEAGKPVEELERELGIRGAIKLASNENPLGPPPLAVEAMKREAELVAQYPESDAPLLKDKLARRLDVAKSEILVGNGSNEIIELLVRTFVTTEHHAVISDHAFLVYPLVLTAAGVPYTSVPMRDWTHDLAAMRAAVNERTRLLFIANPNNPTGTYNPADEVAELLHALPEHVIPVLDEAYFEYAEAPDYASALALRDHHSNLVVLRTFSKAFGLAGLRIGYGVAPEKLVDYMNRVRQPFNTNRVAQVAAAAALDDTQYLERSITENRNNRRYLSAELERRDLQCTPSHTNFLFVRTRRPGSEVAAALLRQGVIVRAMEGYGCPNHIRITVGTREQNAQLLTALDTVMG